MQKKYTQSNNKSIAFAQLFIECIPFQNLIPLQPSMNDGGRAVDRLCKALDAGDGNWLRFLERPIFPGGNQGFPGKLVSIVLLVCIVASEG